MSTSKIAHRAFVVGASALPGKNLQKAPRKTRHAIDIEELWKRAMLLSVAVDGLAGIHMGGSELRDDHFLVVQELSWEVESGIKALAGEGR